MERPHPATGPADSAAARRAAAARRRAVLATALLVLTVVATVLAAASVIPAPVVAVPAVLLVTVLVLGRRAVLSAQRREAARETHRESAAGGRGPDGPRPRGRGRGSATGRAVHGSQSHTQLIARVASPAEDDEPRPSAVRVERGAADRESRTDAPEPAAAAVAPSAADSHVARPAASPAAGAPGAVDADRATTTAPADASGTEPRDAAWNPVPVPRPVYTMKAAAPRWDPAPLTAELRQLTEARRAEIAAGSVARALALVEEPTPDEPSRDSLGVDLESVLARRRAAGE